MDDATRAKIELSRLRFLGLEAVEAKAALARFLDHCYALDHSVPPDEHAHALAVYSYLEDFARRALF